MKIGIFAGTFDPVHAGHVAFAHKALDLGLDRVYFLPEPRPRRKQGVRALEHRLAMINLAISDEPRFGSIQLKQARFTPHETLPVLAKRFAGAELVLLFGDDVIGHIAHWPHIIELVDTVELFVATRHHNIQKLAETFHILHQTSGLQFRYRLVEPAQQSVSSSLIRAALKSGQPVKHLDLTVQGYIHSHRLYRSHRPRKTPTD